MIREWKAIVMAGKNDGSVVEGKPICLSQLLGMPVIQYVLDALKEAGAKEICVLSSEEPEEYEKVLAEGDYQVRMKYFSWLNPYLEKLAEN